MLLAISIACGIEVSSEERAALLDAGERMRQASGLSTEEIAKLGPAYQRTAERSCANPEPRFHEVVKRLVDQDRKSVV